MEGDGLENQSKLDVSLASQLPGNIRFGTSSWTYEGWAGLIYKKKYKSEKEFNTASLGEYSSFPIFRTVCLDSTFYRPPSEKTLEKFFSLTPPDFVFVSKVWDEITIPKFPELKRHGARAGKTNSNFLNAEIFRREVLTPYRSTSESSKIGPFVFQFPTLPETMVQSGEFLQSLRDFLSDIPHEFRYAIEVRNPSLLSNQYFSLLNEYGCTHCFNRWFNMPSLRDQMIASAKSGGLSSDFYVARLLTPQNMRYESCVRYFEPYDKIKKIQPDVRHQAVMLANRAIKRQADAFILVNNRLEGNAPLTINAIMKEVVNQLKNDSGEAPEG